MRDRRWIDHEPELRGELQRRQLPQPAEQPLGPAPHEHELAGVLDPDQRAGQQRQLALLLAPRDHGELVLPAGARSLAMHGDRADQATRRGRRAQRRAELHEALVEIARRGGLGQRLHQRAGALPQRLHPRGRLDVVLDREHPREHPRDVAVDQRRALIERDRRDRARRVRADPGYPAELGRTPRQLAAPRLPNGARAGPQVPRPRVVAEPAPGSEHVVERCGGEHRNRRKLRHPALPVRDHRRHPRLLQHDLADPDRVGIPRSTPRQIAAHGRVVRGHGLGDRAIPVGRHRPLVPGRRDER